VNNPYAAPKADLTRDPHAGKDSADLFIETLPSPVLRAAGVAWLVTGILNLFLAFRMILSLVATPVALLLEASHVAVGLVAFAVGAGLMRGRRVASLAGLALTPFTLGLSAFALVTGSLAGLFGVVLTFVSIALTLATLKEVGRIGEARRALSQRSAEGGA
jgi:CHASE2 domain-containing sensor protein